MVWKEGLLIKLGKIGIKGRAVNWIKDFLYEVYIRVKIETTLSSRYRADNGTPQGCVISPFTFFHND